MSQEHNPDLPLVYPWVEVGLDGVESQGEKNEEWISPDKKRRITSLVIGGGKWNSVWAKEVSLLSCEEESCNLLMRVVHTKNADTGTTTTSVQVEALKTENGLWFLESFGYSLESEGKRESLGVSEPIDTLDGIENLAKEEIVLESDLPERIDVEETARLFIEQLQERSLGRPILIAI